MMVSERAYGAIIYSLEILAPLAHTIRKRLGKKKEHFG
jgi:hypothetical protein